MKSQTLAIANRVAMEHAIVDSGFTQRRIARKLRIDETRLSRIINARIVPTAREQKRIATFLRRSQAELFLEVVAA